MKVTISITIKNSINSRVSFTLLRIYHGKIGCCKINSKLRTDEIPLAVDRID